MIVWLSSKNLSMFKYIHEESEYLTRLERLNMESFFSADMLYVLAHNQDDIYNIDFYEDVSVRDFMKAKCEMYLYPDALEPKKVFASYVNNYATMLGITLDLNALISSSGTVDKLSSDNVLEPQDGVLVLPERISSIEQEAYMGNHDLTKLICSSNLWYIGASAFRNTVRLTDVTFGQSVMQISQFAFAYSGIQRLICPGALRNIDNYAFAGCSNLIEVQLNDGLQTIDAYAFNSCTHLKSLSIPLSVEHIYTGAFSQCYGLCEIQPVHTKVLESHVFFGCRALREIEFTGDVEKIGSLVLQECSHMEKVVISASIDDIARDAFIGLPKNTKFIIRPDMELTRSIVPLRLYQMDITFEVEG